MSVSCIFAFHDNHIGVNNIYRPVLLDKLVEKISIVFDWSSGCHFYNKHLSSKTKNTIMARYKMRVALKKVKTIRGIYCSLCV